MKIKIALVLAGIALQACTLNVPLESPAVSSESYSKKPSELEKIDVSYSSNLKDGHSFSESKLPIKITFDGKPVQTEGFVEKHLFDEISARGLNVGLVEEANTSLTLNDLKIISHRRNGYSPMVTLTLANVDLQTEGGDTSRLVSFVKRGKVPVWAMSEVFEPCYNEPAELVMKELTAKVNRLMFNYSMSDAYVKEIEQKIRANDESSGPLYLSVYELGFSNNQSVVPFLIELTSDEREYVRLSAISSLGIIGAEDQLDLLKNIYTSAKLWQDRAMALKAIADFANDESLAFLKQERSSWVDDGSKESTWNQTIIAAYLD